MSTALAMWLGEEDPHLLARAFVEAPDEMPAAQSWASRRGLELVYDGVALTSSLKLAGAGIDDDQPAEPYLLIASFDSYRLLPPIWQFRHPETGKDIGVPAYPKPVGESVLHPNGLICAHWSRLAYKEHGGPHPNWGGPSAWQRPVEGTVALTIPDMLDRLVREVSWSRGRMAPLPS